MSGKVMSGVAVTAASVLAMIQDSVKNAKPETISLTDVHTVGDWVRQGDIYITLMDPASFDASEYEAVPENWNGQLAEGEGVGSRHIIDNPKIVQGFRKKNREFFEGYVVKTGSSPVEVTHPDHGHVILGANCVFRVHYQVNMVNDERRRVQD